MLAGTELVGLKPHEICRHGVGRTFQVVRAFPRMTVLENVIVGAYVGTPNNIEAERLAMAALERVGMADKQAYAVAGALTTKQLRLMELARALAPKPGPRWRLRCWKLVRIRASPRPEPPIRAQAPLSWCRFRTSVTV